ncbi:PREDICTED: uncharacterized protein LOC105559924 [Vollenhovia emeryi]|uniref:uncharacterized protein LOC105559924 n=1 Tax=Vollenhovia emeryi TaxID=411798 RepID=UPI0005F43F78|nr:PREDICTED: uncharacterized protein LOC105559924 [Vollenhovia emeryi]
MSRFYVSLVNVVAVALTMISVASTSEKVNRGLGQIEKPIMFRAGDIGSLKNRDVVPFADSSSIFFLRKCKPQYQYQKLDRIDPTTTTTTTTAAPRACICVPFYLCDSNRTIITDGSGVIDVR